MQKNRKLISFDWAIKKILRDKANFEVLEGFLSELLFDDIKILEILESESNKELADDKQNRLDIKIKNTAQEIILIEIQYNREFDYLQRIIYNTSKAIVEHIKEGDAYAKVVKVISIDILYFDLGVGEDYIYHGKTVFKGLHSHDTLKLSATQRGLYQSEKIEEIFPEHYLIKVNSFNDVLKDKLDEWIYFLKNEDIRENFNAKGLLKAKEILDYLKCPEEEKAVYERYKDSLRDQASMYHSTYEAGEYEGMKKGIQQGMQQGMQMGEEKGILIGETKGQALVIQRQLIRRFGILSDHAKSRLQNATSEQLECWADRLLDAPTLEAVFAEH